ncbi:ABC transporter permease [Natronoglycomyces albus]|uniref:ABC transporter permease n=1 Tax=Natronoglycomyces albus TaxID=2811108 RepID=A0A895XMM8_9ACTN|nr:ABC transporter permease [Natronoglycomyces albus]QSB04793.1 ABC transporter permease [Natronoglycomyces albus]
MSVIARGARNALRNKARTGAVVLVLAVAIGLTLSMLVAGEAVRGKLDTLRADMDATVSIWPGFEPGTQFEDIPRLTEEELDKVSGNPLIADATATVSALLQPRQDPDFEDEFQIGSPLGAGAEPAQTDLEPGFDGEALDLPEGFSFPISVTGTTGDRDATGARYRLTEGQLPTGDREAVISEQIAKANDLGIGDTFSANDEDFTIVGIAASAGEFDAVGVVMTVPAVQEISENDGYDAIVADVRDVDDIEAAVDSIVADLGAAFDVRSDSQSLLAVSAGLTTVADITTIGFWVALTAAALVVFFTLAMTVRERRKEIGVIKAIGGTNRGVITQFATEAVVLVFLAAILGLGVAAVSSGFTADALVATNVSDTGEDEAIAHSTVVQGSSDGISQIGDAPSATSDLVGSITASVGLDTLGVGALVALGIALLGSAAPAWLIARVRPAEVLKGE